MGQHWLNEFDNYLGSKKGTKRGMKESSRANYLSYIRRFLEISEFKKTGNDISDLFEVSIIKAFYDAKPGNIASAVLVAFSEFLFENKKIDKPQLLNIKHNLLELKKPQKKVNEFHISSEKELDFILGDTVYYRFINDPDRFDKEISIVGPVIWALALTGFEQKQLIDLSMQDLDVSHNHYRIRNLYKGNDELLTEWITLDDKTKSNLIHYLEYRSTLSVESDRLLLIEKKPLNNTTINQAFSIFKRVENIKKLNCEGEINAQLLVRSRLTLSLFQTNGNCLMDIIKIFGMGNAQVSYAVRKYLSQTKSS